MAEHSDFLKKHPFNLYAEQIENPLKDYSSHVRVFQENHKGIELPLERVFEGLDYPDREIEGDLEYLTTAGFLERDILEDGERTYSLTEEAERYLDDFLVVPEENFENIKEKLGDLYEQEPDLDGEILDILENDKDRLELIDDAQFFIEEAEKNFRDIVNGDFEDSKEAAEKYVAADTLIDDLKQSLQLLMPIYSKEVKEISGELQKTKVFQTQVYTALEKPVKDIEDRGYQKITELKSQNTKQPQPKPSA